MKKGDKVRFLYTKGGGVVKGFQGKDVVLVEDETGFEIPIMTNECIVVEEGEPQVRTSNKVIFNPEILKEEKEPVYQYEEMADGDDISVHIIFLSNDIKNISSSPYEAYLVNESNYFLNFTYLSKVDDKYKLRVAGLVEPNTQIFLEEFSNTQANELENICFQAIAYKENKAFTLKQSISKNIRFDITKLFKVHCFRDNQFFDEKAIVLSLIINDQQVDTPITFAKDIENAMLTKKDSNIANAQTKSSKKIEKKNQVIEIDLHINELVDNTTGLSNTDMLQLQIKKFNDVLQEHSQKGQKIVFIHGKGEGVLRNAILEELKRKYKNYTYQDASFQEYGYGATLVTIK